MSKVDYSLESRMNALLKRLGLDYAVLWQPDPDAKHDAMTFPEKKIIEIYVEDSDSAFNALIHEIMELRLKDFVGMHIGIENTLLTLLQQIAYRKKEEAIERIIEDMRAISEFEKRPTPIKGEVFNLSDASVSEE